MAAFTAQTRTRDPSLSDATDEQILRQQKVIVESGAGDACLSIAGLLALGRSPHLQIPKLRVEFTAYPTNREGETGENAERFSDMQNFEGPIPRIYPQTVTRLAGSLHTAVRITGVREDIPEFPEVVLREVVINALVHRDLSASALSRAVQVKLFPNRIEIGNPGGLYQLDVDRLGDRGVSTTRNSRLMQILEDSPLPGSAPSTMIVENRGSGIPAIFAALRHAQMRLPRFSDEISFFEVTLPRGSLWDIDTLAWLASIDDASLGETQRTGLAIARNEGTLTNSSYRHANDLDSQDARTELRGLVTKGYLDQEGYGKGTNYTLSSQWAKRDIPPSVGGGGINGGISGGINHTAHPAPATSATQRREDLLQHLRQTGGARVPELASILQVPVRTVQRDIAALASDGKVRHVGARKTGHYEAVDS